MASRKRVDGKAKKGPLELQVEALQRIAAVFQEEAEVLRRKGPTESDASVGPAAAAESIPAEALTADSEFGSDDIAERLEWVTDEWKEQLRRFLDQTVEDGAGTKFFELYEIHNYNHAAEVLISSYPSEFAELVGALLAFRIRTDWIVKSGGNESPIPQALQQALYPLGWHETRLKGHMVFESHIAEKRQRLKGGRAVLKETGFPAYDTLVRVEPTLRQLVVDAHKIDHVKGRVAFDMEWNSKDQTFDRDLYAMRLFHEAHLIGAGVLLTRSQELNWCFKQLDRVVPKLSSKYGASTTWMGKLLYRLRSSRSGGCPVLALGIRPSCIEDWASYFESQETRTSED